MQVVAHNLLANFSSRQLNITSGKKAKSAEKLSTGYKINKSADDAAGLTISEKMRFQIRGLNKGSDNTQEGISMLQVADGALDEVHAMLQRMRELTVQAANDTNMEEDREAIQKEINSIISEIDRVGADTEYNAQKIFQGGYTTMVDSSGNPIPISQIPVSDFQLARAELQNTPFSENSSGYYLNLGVSTVDGYTESTWDLIYGDGNTSHSTIRIEYENDNGEMVSNICELEYMNVSNFSYNNGTNTYTRTFSYAGTDGVQFEIEQKINIGDNTGTEQYYNMSYSVTNTGTRDAKIDFMFNADTAYNNNDRCEEYYVDGTKVDRFCMYTSDVIYKNQGSSNVYDISGINTSNSFSIIDGDDALPFSETVKWGVGNGPDTVLIGDWTDGTGEWSYYDRLNQMLGGTTDNRDLAFSLIWNRNSDVGTTQTFDFQYGIIKASTDVNLQGVDITYNSSTQVHINQFDLWIQSGEKQGNGLYISIGEMNSGCLGIRGCDVSNFNRASSTITAVDKAINMISENRSRIGAQQNRLECIVKIDDNTSENTQAAESRIRDTDMAEEMMQFTKHNILEQAGQSILAQANQSQQGILTLLQ